MLQTKSIEVVIPQDDPDFLMCWDYIVHRELGIAKDGVIHRFTMQEYVDREGISRQAGYDRLKKWTDKGLLRQIRELMTIPIGEEVTIANRSVMSDWPEIIENIKRIAKSGKEHNAVNAAIFLEDRILRPLIENQPEDGADEANYIQGRATSSLDPMSIVGDNS